MVVATRYHNVMCALKLCKPTISLGYSRKFISLMTDMGLAEFHQFADSLDLDRLIEQFKELESRHAELQQQMAERNAAHRQSLADQFASAVRAAPAGQQASARRSGRRRARPKRAQLEATRRRAPGRTRLSRPGYRPW